MNVVFEQGPIRPPSEAQSLLIRVTRNCPWNRCAFCHTYKDTTFELRSVEEVKQDIQAAREMADEVRAISWKLGEGGGVGKATVNRIFYQGDFYGDSFKSVAAWLYYGGESVFLQDANSLILKTKDMVEILNFIRETFPQVSRVTSYCRSKTAAKKSVEEFKSLREAGLSRIHVGMETGYDPLLDFIRKGVTAAEQIEGGKRIAASGISLSEYVMPGLGGTRWSREHALETARVLNQINPHFIRLRSLQVRRGTALYDKMSEGLFEPLGEEDVVREIRDFIEALEGINSTVVSDHILNLLEEVEGKLPGDKSRMLDVIDRYLALPEEERMIFRLGRRQGFYRRLDDLADRDLYQRLQPIAARYLSSDPAKMDRDLDRMRQSFI
jgi:radical SAM superfamily enzyme YgiQ (UPF0313 family)